MDTKIIMCAFALVLGASSCAKTEQERPADPVKVTFNVAGLDVSSEPMTKSGDAKNASDGLTKIMYCIASSTTSTIGTQVNTDTGFGTIEMWLSPGTYTAYFVGTTDESENVELYKSSSTTYSVSIGNADTFMSTSSLTIADASSYEITMTRKTGQIVVDLTDENVPEIIKSAKISVIRASSMILGTEKVNAGIITTEIQPENGQFPQYISNSFPFNSMDVSISLLDTNSGVLGTTSVTCSVVANKRTIIRGNILDIVTQKGLSVQYDDTWDDDNIVDLNGND